MSTPFRGPGFEAQRGVTAKAAGDTVVVALTHAVLHNRRRDDFDEHVDRVRDSMSDHAGLIGYSIGKELFGDKVWTLSAWVDEESLDAFVRSHVHRQAMRAGKPALKTLRTTRFEIPTNALPLSWDAAFERLEQVEARRVNDAQTPPWPNPSASSPNSALED